MLYMNIIDKVLWAYYPEDNAKCLSFGLPSERRVFRTTTLYKCLLRLMKPFLEVWKCDISGKTGVLGTRRQPEYYEIMISKQG
jgi:hypothetical protein